MGYQEDVRGMVKVALSFAFAVTLAQSAFAQEPSPTDVESARASFLQGLDLRDRQHDLANAIVRFKAAYALVPTPRIGYELGRTLRQSGDLAARAAFVAAMGLPPRPTESAEAKRARTESEAQAVDLEQRIPQVQIHLQGKGQVFVDGEAVRHDALAGPRRLNPGSHVIQVQVEGDVKSEHSVILAEGERKEVTMGVGAAPQVTVTEPAIQMVALPNNGYQFPVARHSNAGVKTGFLVASATLAGVGIVPGLIALGYVKAAQNACASGPCDSSFDSSKTLAYGFGIATDVTWGAAIVCFVIGLAIPSYTTADITVGVTPLTGGGLLGAHGRF